MGISPRLATGRHVLEAPRGGLRAIGYRRRTQQLLELHNGAAGAQLVVHRVSVGVVLAMVLVKVVVVNGRRAGRVHCEARHCDRRLYVVGLEGVRRG